ncbi:aspartate kinase [bacterium]|nr:aspartate kinase [bacterium]
MHQSAPAPFQVFKFGGASIQDATGLRRVGDLLDRYASARQLIVVSASGKTTNALERLLEERLLGHESEAVAVWDQMAQVHLEMGHLCDAPLGSESVAMAVQKTLIDLRLRCFAPLTGNYAADYDRIVGCGELLSNALVAAYLAQRQPNVSLLDAYAVFRTDSNHRQARIDWGETTKRLTEATEMSGWYVLPGFIGADAQGNPTTLGREGSDYTASAAAFMLGAHSVTIWKDVPGFLSGDPKAFPEVHPIARMSYEEAIELAFYGASVIHPKAVQPVKKAGIPLYIKSFLYPQHPGTCIDAQPGIEPACVCLIRSAHQSLVRLSTRELSFVAEDHLIRIYRCFHRHGIKVNLSQLSAAHASFCFASDPRIEPVLFDELQADFDLEHRNGLSLYTAYHHDADARKYLRSLGQVVIEQRSPVHFRVLLEETQK